MDRQDHSPPEPGPDRDPDPDRQPDPMPLPSAAEPEAAAAAPEAVPAAEVSPVGPPPLKTHPDGRHPVRSHARGILIGIVIAATVGQVSYRLLVHGRLEQTAALFIGLPALLAIAAILTPPAKSATGAAFRTIMIALFMSGPMLGEGFICVLMATPLFLLVALIIGLIEDAARARPRGSGRNRLRAVGILPILVMSLEGVHEKLTFTRERSVTAERLISASPEECRARLAQTPDFSRPLPPWLAIGWPRPVRVHGSGLEPGALRVIHFVGGEGSPGDLTMRVDESRPGLVRFAAVSDTSHFPHWLDWRDAVVVLEPTPDGRTRATWTQNYIRRLDPAWYFGPWTHYTMGLAAEYLLDCLVVPAGA